jgi:hypothetical protein
MIKKNPLYLIFLGFQVAKKFFPLLLTQKNSSSFIQLRMHLLSCPSKLYETCSKNICPDIHTTYNQPEHQLLGSLGLCTIIHIQILILALLILAWPRTWDFFRLNVQLHNHQKLQCLAICCRIHVLRTKNGPCIVSRYPIK